ncbi:MAG: hypothetical protein IKP06_06955 [Elusimicrobiaceae bacterium]|nr:hypothetical protein [Elusimicrobiaceae bacterium]
MKKMWISALLAALGLCFSASGLSAAETDDLKSCQAANIEYMDHYGGGDEAGVVYNNVFTRFVPAKDGAQSFWFYVYQKGKIWLCEGAEEDDYKDFPEYITVRVYEGEQGKTLRAKYTVQNAGYIATSAGSYTMFYFDEGGQTHAVLEQLKPGTTVLSAPFSGIALTLFQVSTPLRQLDCGEETPEFMEMLNSVTLL